MKRQHTSRDYFKELLLQGYVEVLYLKSNTLYCDKHPYWSCPVHYAASEVVVDLENDRMLCAVTHSDVKGILVLKLFAEKK